MSARFKWTSDLSPANLQKTFRATTPYGARLTGPRPLTAGPQRGTPRLTATSAFYDRSAGMILSPADMVGTAAALCSMTSFMPQIVKIWRERDASSVSLRMYVVTVTGFSLWVAYGVLTSSWPVVGSNVVCLILSAIILGMKWRFSR